MYCECGCGEKAPISKQNRPHLGHVKGEPVRFIRGHHSKFQFRESAARWNGGKSKRSTGYVFIHCPGHPRGDSNGYVQEHILIVEAALGKSLPRHAEVHHLNEIRCDNQNSNLIVCEDRGYHRLLHQRRDAQVACGNVDWRKCPFCKSYDDPVNMRRRKSGQHYHLECDKNRQQKIRDDKKKGINEQNNIQ